MSDSRLDSAQVKKVAKLANLPLTPDEESLYGEQLSKILEYVDQLNEVDTSNVDPVYNVTGLENVFRGDDPKSSLTQDEAVKNAPTSQDGFFVTKGVFEGE